MAGAKPTAGQKLFKRLRDFHAHTIDAANSAEAKKSYQDMLDKELSQHGKTMADLAALLDRAEQLGIEDASDWLGQPLPGAAGSASYDSLGADAPLQLSYGLLSTFTYQPEHQYVGIALWILHTFVYDLYQYTPRLLVGSPVPGCGKSKVMDIIKGTSANGEKYDGTSDAAVWHTIDTERPAPLIIDEADNLKIEGHLLAAFNAGWEMGGNRMNMWGPKKRTFELFAPLAMAGVIRDPARLNHTLLERCVYATMTKDNGGRVQEPFSKKNPEHMALLDLAWNYAREWAVKVRSGEIVLNPTPAMPTRLRNRTADNWRVLFAIADSFGPEWGARARAAALAFERGRMVDDPGLLALQDIRDAFASAECCDLESTLRTGSGTFINSGGVKAFASIVLVKTMAACPPWDSWTGFDGKQTPHELRQGELAAILRAFGIRPRTQWPRARRKDSKSCNGYEEDQFKQAWNDYLGDGDTPSQPTPLAKLFGVKQ